MPNKTRKLFLTKKLIRETIRAISQIKTNRIALQSSFEQAGTNIRVIHPTRVPKTIVAINEARGRTKEKSKAADDDLEI